MTRLLSHLNCSARRLWPVGIMLLLCCHAASWAYGDNSSNTFQERTIKGRVTSADDGLGFPGVNIIVKGTTRGTVSDAEGNYSIEVPSTDAILVFSSIGYKTTEIAVGTQTDINLAIEPDVTSLSEVVVVGYGTVKKSDVTGALASVSGEQLRAIPVQSISQALQGRASGVDISQSSFRPGDNPVIRIRGNRSLIGGNDPLIVLDGIPLPEGSGINDFNPNDVESIEVLKDASSASIYGSRGANGVILVTTKRGKAGKAKVSYDGYVGVSSPLATIDMMNGGQFAELRREANRNNSGLVYSLPWADVAQDFAAFSGQDIEMWNSVADGYQWVDRANRIPVTRPVTAEEREAYEAYYQQAQLRYPVGSTQRTAAVNTKLNNLRALLDDPNLQIPVYDPSKVRTTDWGDLALRTGIKQSHQFSVSGGSDNVGVFFGGGYYSDRGIQESQAFKRFNVKLGLDYKVSDAIKVGGTISGTSSNQAFGSPLYFRAIGQLPVAIPYDAEGRVILQPGGDALIFSPLNEIEDFVDDRRTNRAFGSFYADAKLPIKGLRYHVNVGTDFKHYRRGRYQGALTSDRRGGTSWADYSQEQNFTYVLENLLYYDKQVGVHNFGVTALYSIQEDRFESSGVNVANLPYESALYYNLGSTYANGPDAFASDFTKKVFISYMGRINYSLMDKYLLTVTGRYDGLSPLAPGNKWGFFPSASLAWKIHQEAFMDNLNLFDELKLRVGYGEVGNAAVPPYLAPGRVIKTPYVWGESAAWGFVPQFFPNPSLKWESTRSLNVGIDFGILGGRINGSIEGYQQNTQDLMMYRNLPTASGFSSYLENVGKVRNTGIELSLNSVNVDAGDLKWTTGIIFSKNKEELVELYGGTNDDLGNRWFIGHPITTYYDWQPIGVWQSDEWEAAKAYGRIPGQGKIKDQLTVDSDGDGVKDAPDGVINASDMVIRGNNVPKWTGSIVNTVSYKGIELSFMIYTRQGQIIASGYYRPALAGRYTEPAFVDYWTPTNPTNVYPRPTTDQERIDYPNSYLYQDASFVKMRNITLSYTFPKSVISRFKMENLKIYATAFNPFLWTDFKGGDPEFYANSTRIPAGQTLPVPITNIDDQLVNASSGSNLSERSFVFGVTVGF